MPAPRSASWSADAAAPRATWRRAPRRDWRPGSPPAPAARSLPRKGRVVRASRARASGRAGWSRCPRQDASRCAERAAARAPSVALVLFGARAFIFRGRLIHAGRQLAEHEVIEHRTRQWRRGTRTEAAVLHHDGERDARALERREGDKERMVAVALGDFRLLVLFVLLDRDDLRRAGLAAGGVGDAGEGARGGALLDDAGHRALDELDVLSPERHRVQRLSGQVAALAAARVIDVRDKARLVHGAARGEHRHRLRELQRRVGVIALADADRDGLAREPLLLGRLLEALHLPLGRRQHAGEFAGEIDAALRAEAERSEEARDCVDAHVIREVVVVGVAGLDDRLVHVDDAMAALLVIAETPAAEVEIPGIEDAVRGPALAGLERGKCQVRLDGGSWRVKARNRAVVERLVDRAVELGPVLRVDAVDEQIRIEAGLRDERQHAAARRIDGDERAAPIAEGDLRDLLQAHVELERQVVARLRGRAR